MPRAAANLTSANLTGRSAESPRDGESRRAAGARLKPRDPRGSCGPRARGACVASHTSRLAISASRWLSGVFDLEGLEDAASWQFRLGASTRGHGRGERARDRGACERAPMGGTIPHGAAAISSELWRCSVRALLGAAPTLPPSRPFSGSAARRNHYSRYRNPFTGSRGGAVRCGAVARKHTIHDSMRAEARTVI